MDVKQELECYDDDIENAGLSEYFGVMVIKFEDDKF